MQAKVIMVQPHISYKLFKSSSLKLISSTKSEPYVRNLQLNIHFDEALHKNDKNGSTIYNSQIFKNGN